MLSILQNAWPATVSEMLMDTGARRSRTTHHRQHHAVGAAQLPTLSALITRHPPDHCQNAYTRRLPYKLLVHCVHTRAVLQTLTLAPCIAADEAHGMVLT